MKNLKNTIAAIGLITVLGMGATTAKAGLLMSDRTQPADKCASTDGLIMSDKAGLVMSDRTGLVMSDRTGLVMSDSTGLIISDAVGLLVSDVAGLIMSDKAETVCATTDGIIVSD